MGYRDDYFKENKSNHGWYTCAKCGRKLRKGDSYDSNHNELYMNFRPKYYFLGLSVGAQSANKKLPQTIGWEATYNASSFDPLAE